MTALRQTWQVYLRGVRVFIRQPAYLGMTLIQPIIWLLLFGALFKAVTQIPGFQGSSYIDFLTPGLVVMLAQLPLTFLSAALMQQSLAPGWIQSAAKFNPVNWAVVAARGAAMQKTDWGLVAGRLGLLAALTLVCMVFATRAFAKYQRSL